MLSYPWAPIFGEKWNFSRLYTKNHLLWSYKHAREAHLFILIWSIVKLGVGRRDKLWLTLLFKCSLELRVSFFGNQLSDESGTLTSEEHLQDEEGARWPRPLALHAVRVAEEAGKGSRGAWRWGVVLELVVVAEGPTPLRSYWNIFKHIVYCDY